MSSNFTDVSGSTPINPNPPGFFTNLNQADNPDNNQDIYDFQTNINSWSIENVNVLTIQTLANYTDFGPSNLTNDNIATDKETQTIMRNQVYIEQNYNVNWAQGWNFWSKYIYKTLLNATFYQIPWYEVLEEPTLQVSSICNYAVRLHFFEYNVLDAKPVISIVDCISGDEKFRVVAPDASTQVTESNNPSYLRNVKRVTNGVVDMNTILTFGEMLKINTCINTEIVNYPPWDALQSAKKNTDPTKDPEEKAVTDFQDAVAKTPFVDGVNGEIQLGQIRLFAIDSYTQGGNYLFGLSFLPWNNGAYQIFDNQYGEYVGYSPINTSNFLTILKLIGMGLILFEFYEIIRSGKFKTIHLSYY
jgi:hypothetical protein